MNEGVYTLREGVYSSGNLVNKWLDIKISIFHVTIYFCFIFRIKLKKMWFYLFSIYVFVYLCVKINSVT